MTNQEITGKITNIKENYMNGNITGVDLCELLQVNPLIIELLPIYPKLLLIKK